MTVSQKRPLAAFWILTVLIALVMTAGLREGAARTLVHAGAPDLLAGPVAADLLLGGDLAARPLVPVSLAAPGATAAEGTASASVPAPGAGAGPSSRPSPADPTPPAATAPATPAQAGPPATSAVTSPTPKAPGHAHGKGKNRSAKASTMRQGKAPASAEHGKGHGKGHAKRGGQGWR